MIVFLIGMVMNNNVDDKVIYTRYSDYPVSYVLDKLRGKDIVHLTLIATYRAGGKYVSSTYAKKEMTYYDLEVYKNEIMNPT